METSIANYATLIRSLKEFNAEVVLMILIECVDQRLRTKTAKREIVRMFTFLIVIV